MTSDGTDDQRPGKGTHGRDIFYIDETDFATIHNLLCYCYTGCVNMYDEPNDLPQETGDMQEISMSAGYPEPVPSAFKLYATANMYLAGALEDRCRQFLIKTSTPDNICERLFNIACNPYKDLTKDYVNYLVENYDKVKDTDGWKDVPDNMAGCSVDEVRFFSQILQISTAFTQIASESSKRTITWTHHFSRDISFYRVEIIKESHSVVRDYTIFSISANPPSQFLLEH